MSFDEVGRNSLTRLFEQRVEETPDSVAVRAVPGQLTFSEWYERAAALSELLHEAFPSLAQERVLLWMTNDDALAFVCAFQALAGKSAVVVALDDRSTALEARGLMDECEPKALLTSRRVCLNLGSPGLSQLGVPLESPLDRDEDVSVVPLDEARTGGEVIVWPSDHRTQSARVADEARAEDDALIAYTSGSTGAPKGALLTQSAICQYGERVTRATYAAPRGDAHLGPRDVLQSPIPLYTAASVIENLSPTIFSGCTLVYEARRFDPAASERRIRELETTVYNGAPPHFAMMCDLDLELEPSPNSLELLISGGSALTEALYWRMKRRWPDVAIANWYGLNESGTGQTLNYSADIERAPAAIGRPLWPTEVKVVNDAGEPVESGIEGELWMRAPGQMRKYFRNPGETRKLLQGGWLRTGDRAVRDADGLIHIVGRGEERINRGGFKFYPDEVEAALEMHPGVREAAVVAVPDPVLGQDTVAFVALRDGSSSDEQELRAHCKNRIAAYKVPSHIYFRGRLPRGAYGKVLRRQLVAEHERESGVQAVTH